MYRSGLCLFSRLFIIVLLFLFLWIFKLLISSWFNFASAARSRNSFFSSSRFSSLIKEKFLKCSLLIFWISLVSVVFFPYFSLILLIYILFSFSLFSKVLSIVYFSRKQVLDSGILCIIFLGVFCLLAFYVLHHQFCPRFFFLIFPSTEVGFGLFLFFSKLWGELLSYLFVAFLIF